jgi:ribosomal protein L32
MPLPKRRHSHQRTALRRTHYTTDMPEITPNKQVGGEDYHLRHHATPDGYYKGRRLPGFKDKKAG